MKAVADGLHVRSYTVLRQGDAPRRQLIETFRDDITSVLLGVASFWEGVDVKGEALTVLLIDKLPFPSPKDPIVDAMHSKLGRSAFRQYDLPLAIIKLRQGSGRLIRTMTDRGILVLCDRRLLEKSYGKQFLEAIPSMRITRDIREIEEFLK